MSKLNYLVLFIVIFSISSCSSEEKKKKELVIPDKITMLFVTQPNCPSCTKLEEVMKLKQPQTLIDNYFKIKKVYLGEKIPDGLIPPNGTPTVYFLGSNNEVLVEPMIGEQNETALMEFLEDSLYEFNITYGVDIRDIKKQEDLNATTHS